MKAIASLDRQFLGSKPYCLTLTIVTGPLGGIWRIPVADKGEAVAKAEELGIEIVEWEA